MADEQVAVTAPEKKYRFIIRQAGLNGNNSKIPAIKFLYAVGKAEPAKIMRIKSYIVHGCLQQTLIYTIAEGIKALDGLGASPGCGCIDKNTAV